MDEKTSDPPSPDIPSGTNLTGWPVFTAAVKTPPLWLSSTATVFATMFAFLLLVLSFVAVWHLAKDLFGSDQRQASEAVKSLLPMAAAAIGLPLIIWRLVILNRQTATAEAKTQIDRETHFTSIFSRAIDQLGTIRELKVVERNKDGEMTQIAKTVPNIEVRLGGIHSLSRLAEESVRDALKINSTLFSYVRENSWSARNGDETSRPPMNRTSSFEWIQNYKTKAKSEETAASYKSWTSSIFNSYSSGKSWAKQINETRVDVKEAVEAIGSLKFIAKYPTQLVFYESLFVGLLFKTSIVQNAKFERCAFIDCHFEADSADKPEFINSSLIDCKLLIVNSAFVFSECLIYDCDFSGPHSSIAIVNSDLVSVSFRTLTGSQFSFKNSSSYLGWYGIDAEITIKASDSTFSEVNFNSDVFSAGSIFTRCALMDLDLDDTNLENVQFVNTDLEHMGAVSSTKHPTGKRPDAWPAYSV